MRLRPVIQPEDVLHAAVARGLTLLVLPPAVWTTFPAGHVKLSKAEAARLARLGLKRGWPDILLIHKGIAHGIELKREGGALSRSYLARSARGSLVWREGQVDSFPRLIGAGMKISICYSLDDVLTSLRCWGVPLRAE